MSDGIHDSPINITGGPMRAERSAGSQQRRVSWRTLSRTTITKKGDRRCYVGGEVGPEIYDTEIGMTVGETGYWRVVRKNRKPANSLLSDKTKR